MRPRLVCDASALVAVLLDAGPDGRWATDRVAEADLAAPALLAFETANIIRRHELAGHITTNQAAQAHADLLDVPVELWPSELLANRARQLRRNLTSYDASYVALAELLGLALATLDRRIAGAPGPRMRGHRTVKRTDAGRLGATGCAGRHPLGACAERCCV